MKSPLIIKHQYGHKEHFSVLPCHDTVDIRWDSGDAESSRMSLDDGVRLKDKLSSIHMVILLDLEPAGKSFSKMPPD